MVKFLFHFSGQINVYFSFTALILLIPAETNSNYIISL